MDMRNCKITKIEKQGNSCRALESLAVGMPMDKVAKMLNVSAPAVKKFKEDNFELIERLRDEFVRKDLPLASQARHDLLYKYACARRRARMDSEDKRAAHQHVIKAHESAGIYPGKTGGVHVNVQTQVNQLNQQELGEDQVFQTLMRLKSVVDGK